MNFNLEHQGKYTLLCMYENNFLEHFILGHKVGAGIKSNAKSDRTTVIPRVICIISGDGQPGVWGTGGHHSQ